MKNTRDTLDNVRPEKGPPIQREFKLYKDNYENTLEIGQRKRKEEPLVEGQKERVKSAMTGRRRIMTPGTAGNNKESKMDYFDHL